MRISSRHLSGALAADIFNKTLNPKQEVLFVGSGHANASDTASFGKSADNPLATIKQALVNLRTVGDDGHVIVVLPGHVETIDSAAEIDIDIDHLTIVGRGGGSEQPAFDFASDTAATFTISGMNVVIENMLFDCSITSLVKMVDITGDDVHLLDCRLDDGGLILIDALVWTGDFGLVDGLFASAPTAGNNSVIQITGTDAMEIRKCRIRCDGVAGAIESVTTASTRYSIHDNEIETLDETDLCIVSMTADQGWISNNRCKLATDTIKTWITASGEVALFENYGTNDGAETGILIGTPSA